MGYITLGGWGGMATLLIYIYIYIIYIYIIIYILLYILYICKYQPVDIHIIYIIIYIIYININYILYYIIYYILYIIYIYIMALSFVLVLLLRRRDFLGRAFLLSDPHQLQKRRVWKHVLSCARHNYLHFLGQNEGSNG